jgi:hypothetical protein
VDRRTDRTRKIDCGTSSADETVEESAKLADYKSGDEYHADVDQQLRDDIAKDDIHINLSVALATAQTSDKFFHQAEGEIQ